VRAPTPVIISALSTLPAASRSQQLERRAVVVDGTSRGGGSASGSPVAADHALQLGRRRLSSDHCEAAGAAA
jgi:hypothetical protein